VRHKEGKGFPGRDATAHQVDVGGEKRDGQGSRVEDMSTLNNEENSKKAYRMR